MPAIVQPKAPAARPASAIELPTLAAALAIHAGWAALTLWHAALPLWLLAVLGGLITAWHGSLQHETIHGHPTGNRLVDYAIGMLPLALWLPYSIYRRSHLAHHATPHTTDPFDDPESHYCASNGGPLYWLARLEATLAGRMLLGPVIRIVRFFLSELRRARIDRAATARDWVPHLAMLLPVLWWLDHVELPLTTYILAFVYPGASLSLLRSFAEHRADANKARRAAIVLRPGLFGILFLNNNLHAVHHARPDLAWYRLPGEFRRNRSAFAGAPHYRSYGDVVYRYAWRAQDEVVHPDYRASPQEHA